MIRTVVRFRPPNEERREQQDPQVSLCRTRVLVDRVAFDFDAVLGPTSTQKDVLAQVEPIITAVKEGPIGTNGTVFVFGASGAGKSHTMIGTGSDRGIVPSVVKNLLGYVSEARNAGRAIELTLSVLEVYAEKIIDKLSRPQSNVDFVDSNFPSSTQVALTSDADALECIGDAVKTREKAKTQSNDSSSRSHLIFVLHLTERVGKTYGSRRLMLADLAGCESSKKSGVSDGKAKREATNINQSLLALVCVIKALSEGNGFVPYRGSKLTRLLQDSIGGTARTLLIACVSPTNSDQSATSSTLNFAKSAGTVRNKSKEEQRCTALEAEVEQLKARLNAVVAAKGGYFVSEEHHAQMVAETARLKDLEAKHDELQAELRLTDAELQRVRSQAAVLPHQCVAPVDAAPPATAAPGKRQRSEDDGVRHAGDATDGMHAGAHNAHDADAKCARSESRACAPPIDRVDQHGVHSDSDSGDAVEPSSPANVLRAVDRAAVSSRAASSEAGFGDALRCPHKCKGSGLLCGRPLAADSIWCITHHRRKSGTVVTWQVRFSRALSLLFRRHRSAVSKSERRDAPSTLDGGDVHSNFLTRDRSTTPSPRDPTGVFLPTLNFATRRSAS
jgi:hypothetical protein